MKTPTCIAFSVFLWQSKHILNAIRLFNFYLTEHLTFFYIKQAEFNYMLDFKKSTHKVSFPVLYFSHSIYF